MKTFHATDTKRPRESTFDPWEDPLGALEQLNHVKLENPAQFANARQLLLDFVADQAAVCTLYIDAETTELIEHGTPIRSMTVAYSCT